MKINNQLFLNNINTVEDNSEFLKEALCAIQLSRLPTVGAAKFKNLINKYLKPSTALASFLEELDNIVTSNLPKKSFYKSRTDKEIDNAYTDIATGKVKITWYGKDSYPENLAFLSEPPPVLFYKGQLPQNNKTKNTKSISIVGTRYCNDISIFITQQLVEKLVELGYTIISGGAIGIDTVAHQTALKANGKTIAVLGCGVNYTYPISNKELFKKIINTDGAIISELMPSTKPQRGFFPTRNRIIAGLSPITIVIQALQKSGSIITAKYAIKFGRRVYVYSPSNEIIAKTQINDWLGNIYLLRLTGVTGFTTLEVLLNNIEHSL